jgi:DNA-binding MarR family transcriptional regulator
MIDPLANFPGYALKRASSNMLAMLSQRLALVGISATDATILFLIDANPDATQTDLCKALDINKANMTPRIARLVAEGLVTRERLDGRSYVLVLTEKGKLLKEEAYEISERFEEHLIGRIAPEYLDQFVAALKALWESPDLNA